MDLTIGDDNNIKDDFKFGLAVGAMFGAIVATFVLGVLNVVIRTIF